MFSDNIEERIKGWDYAAEPKRLWQINDHAAIFHGKHQDHMLIFVNEIWQCDCVAWEARDEAGLAPWCRHTIALEYIQNHGMVFQVEPVR